MLPESVAVPIVGPLSNGCFRAAVGSDGLRPTTEPVGITVSHDTALRFRFTVPGTPRRWKTPLGVGEYHDCMTAFGLLRVTPIKEGDITEDVAAAVEALEGFDVKYETTPMATTLEAEDVDELFAACAAAHKAVDAPEIQTLVQLDEKDKEMTANDKVDAVEAELGRDAKSDSE